MKITLVSSFAILLAVCLQLAAGQTCSGNFIPDCNGTCIPPNFIQDAVCDNAPPYGQLNCYLFGCDGGDCQPSECEKTCPAGQIVDCLGKCVSSTLLGNGVCNMDRTTARLDCPKYNCDNGDCAGLSNCTQCANGQIPDCNGNCNDPVHIGDNTCNNGTENWNCSAFNWDNLDCVRCPTGQKATCSGACVPTAAIAASAGDGVCDPRFNCSKYRFDGQDCSPCPTGQMRGCTGACAASSSYHNGVCDSVFNCGAFNFDQGDCSNCNVNQTADCFGYCFNTEFWGDSFCDLNLNCSLFNYDNGTCLQTAGSTTGSAVCQTGYVRDCRGICQPNSFIGDGECDDGRFGAYFNCDAFGCDGGDCTCISTTGTVTSAGMTTGQQPSVATTGQPQQSATTGQQQQGPLTTGQVPQQSTTGAPMGTTAAALGSEDERSGLSGGAVAGIIIGSIIGAVIIILVVGFLFISRRPSKYKLRAAEDMEMDHKTGAVGLEDGGHKVKQLDENDGERKKKKKKKERRNTEDSQQ